MFAEEGSLSRVISDVAAEGDFHSVYIGAHGDANSVYGIGDVPIGRARLRNMFRTANAKGPIAGLYFGSCSIASSANASFWLTEPPTTGLQWIAGYTENVDWVDSAAVDMIFWSKYLRERQLNRGKRRGKKTELEMVKQASSAVKGLVTAQPG
jgi:hypothetical protein